MFINVIILQYKDMNRKFGFLNRDVIWEKLIKQFLNYFSIYRFISGLKGFLDIFNYMVLYFYGENFILQYYLKV